VVVFAVVIVFYIICGCVMDIMSCIFITVPIMYPILTSIGFESYAIMIVLVILVNLGGMTPPIGMGCFITANAVNVNPAVIFKGIIPYCVITVATAFAIAFIPQIVTFLPNLVM
jgi:TRAP-type C4-dicarboxylate transport system permease large subunit